MTHYDTFHHVTAGWLEQDDLAPTPIACSFEQFEHPLFTWQKLVTTTGVLVPGTTSIALNLLGLQHLLGYSMLSCLQHCIDSGVRTIFNSRSITMFLLLLETCAHAWNSLVAILIWCLPLYENKIVHKNPWMCKYHCRSLCLHQLGSSGCV